MSLKTQIGITMNHKVGLTNKQVEALTLVENKERAQSRVEVMVQNREDVWGSQKNKLGLTAECKLGLTTEYKLGFKIM